MRAKYIFRLDDICENMDLAKYNLVKSIFLENGVKPLIGVIPDNRDENFLKYPRCEFDFWEEIRDLQMNKGWSVALHGHTHVYESTDPGILQINSRSEFAGLPKYNQCEKIKKGIEVFKREKIGIDAFMAPAHSFDRVTMECLKENGINVITDGYALYPYYEEGMLFVPQLFSKPRKFPFGIFTWCLHTNSMSEVAIERVRAFVIENRRDIISFSEAHNYCKENYDLKNKMLNAFLKKTLIFARKIKNRN